MSKHKPGKRVTVKFAGRTIRPKVPEPDRSVTHKLPGGLEVDIFGPSTWGVADSSYAVEDRGMGNIQGTGETVPEAFKEFEVCLEHNFKIVAAALGYEIEG